ncbi:DNA-binding response regulator [Streptomyces sp. BF-3]|nr:DNA-binding response regulator [Streptomyces sp. BF-3]
MRVVLAEDLFLLRDGLVRMLEAYDFEIAAAVETGPELSEALAALEPDVAVVDVRLPPSHTDEGLQCALDRVFDADQFIDAVRRVAAGGTAMDPQVISQLLSRRSQDKPIGGLTPREREVMELVAQGRSNAAIAAQLVITERAVAKHTSNIFGKLDLPPSDDDNRRVLAVLAYLDRG